MKNLIIFLIFLFSNCFYSQELNKIEIDAYVNTFSKRDFGEINEGYLGNKAYSYSIDRNINKEISGIIEFVGGRKGTKNEFYFFEG